MVFSLLDLMAIVAAFGIGLGLAMLLPGGPRWAKLAAGVVLGAMLVPPGVLLTRAILGRANEPLRTGERLGVFPSMTLLLPCLAVVVRGAFGMFLILVWICTLLVISAAALGLLQAKRRESDRASMTWLEFYGYLLGLGMFVLALFVMAGLR